MIIRGSGTIGAAGFTGAGACICATLLCTGGCADGGALLAWAAGGVTRDGIPIAGAAVLALVEAEPAAGAVTLGGEILGGVTTTDGGRYVAATEAGVTILGAGGAGGAVSIAGLGGIALGTDGAAETAGT